MPNLLELLGQKELKIAEWEESYKEVLRLILRMKLGQVKLEEVMVQIPQNKWQIFAGRTVVQDENGEAKILPEAELAEPS